LDFLNDPFDFEVSGVCKDEPRDGTTGVNSSIPDVRWLKKGAM
jgi:hypothetical protein